MHSLPLNFRAKAERIVADQAGCDAPRGTNLHGWATPERRVDSVEAVEARLEQEHRDRVAFQASPRGRFLACIKELEETGSWEEAERLRGFYSRSISPLNGPIADQTAIGECILILNGIKTSAAREGIDALAELLVAEEFKAAA